MSGIRLSIALGILTILNLLANLLIQWYVLVIVGPGLQTDALVASLTLPQIVLAVIGGSTIFVLVPLLTGLQGAELRHDFWNFMWVICGFFGALAIVIALTTPWWVGVLFPGFGESGLALAEELARIQAAAMVFTAAASTLRALHHSQRRFIFAETVLFVTSGLSLVLILWALPRYGIISVGWITLFRAVVQASLLMSSVPIPSVPQLNTPSMRLAWRRLRPLLIGSTYYKADPLIDRFFASITAPGGLSLLYLAQQLYSLALQVFVTAVSTPATPTLSAAAKACDWVEFRRVYRQKLALMFGIPVIGSVGLLIFGRPVLTLLVGRGQVTAENVDTLWILMIALLGVPVGGSAGQILSTAFYAKGDTITPTRIGVVGFTFGIGVKILAFYLFGLVGIAIGATLYYGLNLILLGVLLERDVNRVLCFSRQG
ncbi:MAG: virulence factor MviN [Anaerolineae bacterium]|nr:virulence factor MviN [Anaerolineae bacterium]